MSNELEKQLESAKNQLSSLNAEIASYKSQDRFDGYYMMNYHDELILNDLYSSRDDLEQEIALLEEQLRQQKEIENKYKYKISSKRIKNEPNTLKDLRNISVSGNALNFRKNDTAVDEGINLVSKSYYMNKDFLIIDTLSLKGEDIERSNISEIAYGFSKNIEKMSNIQPLILNEFQPFDMLSPADLMPAGIFEKLGEFTNKAIGFLGGNALISLGKNYLMKRNIDEFSKNPEQLYNIANEINGKTKINLHEKNRVRKYFTSDPVQVIQNMFNGGRWLNTFQIPYYGNDYLIANHKQNWSSSDSSNFLGGLAGSNPTPGAAPSVGTKGFGIDFPSNPKWTPNLKSNRVIKTNFYLVNTSTEWLVKNFQFIQAFFAGTSWLHMKYCQVRPPNVYHVLCPGRFQIYWAAMDVTVTFEGKLRKNTEAVTKIKQTANIKSIDEDMLWPEAWKVDVSIKDLTPNNFNLYAEYYQHGFKAEEILSLEEQQSIKDVAIQASAYFSEMFGDLKESMENGLKDAYKGITGKNYKEGTPLTGIVTDLAGGIKDKLINPFTSELGINENQQKLVQAKENYDQIINEYRGADGKVDYDALNADPRYKQRITTYMKANANVIADEKRTGGMSAEQASKEARIEAARAVYGKGNENNWHTKELGWFN